MANSNDWDMYNDKMRYMEETIYRKQREMEYRSMQQLGQAIGPGPMSPPQEQSAPKKPNHLNQKLLLTKGTK